MKKLKIAFHFIRIKLKNIGSILVKTSAGYAVASFGLIQVASIVTDNLSTQSMLGISTESFMQILFSCVLILFPVVLIVSYLTNSDYQKYLFLGYKMVIEFQHKLTRLHQLEYIMLG